MTTGLFETLPLFGVSQNVLFNADMASDLDMAVDAGFTAFAPADAMVHRTGIAETIQLLDERSLTVSSYHTGLMILEMSEVEANDTLRVEIETAGALRAPVIVVCPGSSGGRSPAEADAVLTARLASVAPLARERGVVIGLEPLHPFLHLNSYIHGLGDAARITAAIESCGVVCDLVHLYWDRRLGEDIIRHVDDICLVHLAGLDQASLRERRWRRGPLDGDEVPVAALVGAIHAAGYRGGYENEIIVRQPATECLEAARASRTWFEALRNAPAG